jgi:hypothetical protein
VTGYDQSMVTVHLTEAELAQDVHAALDKVRHGMEIVIDDDRRAVAVIKIPKAQGSMISEDDDLQQWDPPAWA